jgi:hypothetical protein
MNSARVRRGGRSAGVGAGFRGGGAGAIARTSTRPIETVIVGGGPSALGRALTTGRASLAAAPRGPGTSDAGSRQPAAPSSLSMGVVLVGAATAAGP